MEVLNTLLEMEWQTVNNAEALLQVEESGNKIACGQIVNGKN